MKKTLSFAVSIRCPRSVVWQAMLGAEDYKVWTAPFCEGSYFSGTWAKGQKIQFLSPGGDGMVAVIAEYRPHEHVTIQHLGEIRGGVEDTTGPAVREWAPAYENYSFADENGVTVVTVSLDTLPAWEAYMTETYPKALAVLKELCESRAKAE